MCQARQSQFIETAYRLGKIPHLFLLPWLTLPLISRLVIGLLQIIPGWEKKPPSASTNARFRPPKSLNSTHTAFPDLFLRPANSDKGLIPPSHMSIPAMSAHP